MTPEKFSQMSEPERAAWLHAHTYAECNALRAGFRALLTHGLEDSHTYMDALRAADQMLAAECRAVADHAAAEHRAAHHARKSAR
jgi:hypothetical protein